MADHTQDWHDGYRVGRYENVKQAVLKNQLAYVRLT